MKYEDITAVPPNISAPQVNTKCEPLLVTVNDACKLLSCGKTKAFAMINEGVLERRKLGHATRITLASIRKAAGV